jgi:hypothetical protein
MSAVQMFKMPSGFPLTISGSAIEAVGASEGVNGIGASAVRWVMTGCRYEEPCGSHRASACWPPGDG